MQPNLLMIPPRLPEFMYSKAIVIPFSVGNAPYDFIILGWSHSLSICNSDIICYLIRASRLTFTSFKASSFLDGLCYAFLTQPDAPSPNLFSGIISARFITNFF